MSDKSPLFVSASELLAHAIELYTQGKERKYKFVILHLANAIELILKDKLIDLGISIYKNQTTVTISIWDAFTHLGTSGVQVPERPVIELLIDDRNTIQHRFGFPNADAVFYYLDSVLAFFRRFLKDEYRVDLIDVLKLHTKEEHLATVGLIVKKDERAALRKLLAISPEAAIQQAYSQIQGRIAAQLTGAAGGIPFRSPVLGGSLEFLVRQLNASNYITTKDVSAFRTLRDMRNRAAHMSHTADQIPKDEWEKALTTATNILEGIDKASKTSFFTDMREELDRREAERRILSVESYRLRSNQRDFLPEGTSPAETPTRIDTPLPGSDSSADATAT